MRAAVPQPDQRELAAHQEVEVVFDLLLARIALGVGALGAAIAGVADGVARQHLGRDGAAGGGVDAGVGTAAALVAAAARGEGEREEPGRRAPDAQ